MTEAPSETGGERVTELAEVVEQYRREVDRLRETQRELRQCLSAQQRTIHELTEDQPPEPSRRQALTAGGILGLLGLGAGAASATPSGQVGTESRPLETLHAETVESEFVRSDTVETGEIGGDVTGGEGPITTISADASGGSVPRRDDSGELAVADATADGHAISRGQAVLPEDSVNWSGSHDFDSMPAVGGSPVVESDSNSDGSWTRWADGTQIAWEEQAGGSGEYINQGDAFNFVWSYPRSFTGRPHVSGNSRTVSSSDDTASGSSWGPIRGAGNWNGSEVAISCHRFQGGGTTHVGLTAYGRWD